MFDKIGQPLKIFSNDGTNKGVLNPNYRPFSFELRKKLDFLK